MTRILPILILSAAAVISYAFARAGEPSSAWLWSLVGM